MRKLVRFVKAVIIVAPAAKKVYDWHKNRQKKNQTYRLGD